MAKKELTKIESYEGETPNSQIFVMSMSVKGFNTYQKAKAINTFVNSETKVLERVIEGVLRNYLKENGIVVRGGDKIALENAFKQLDMKGKSIELIDRYENIKNEIIIDKKNGMTVIEEESTLSCAMEIRVNGW